MAEAYINPAAVLLQTTETTVYTTSNQVGGARIRFHNTDTSPHVLKVWVYDTVGESKSDTTQMIGFTMLAGETFQLELDLVASMKVSATANANDVISARFMGTEIT